MIKLIQVLGLSILTAVVLVACTTTNLYNYDIYDKEVVYDGNIHVLEYVGEIDVEVEYENNSHIEVGVYEVKATFKYEDETKECFALLTIIPYTLEFDDLNIINTVVYDGSYKYIEYTKIDNIEYDFKYENKYLEVGSYNNTLIITSNNKNYNNTEIEINFNIINNDFNNISFNNESFLYDGTIKKIELENLPSGYNVEYINNEQKEIGEYNVVANILLNDSVVYSLSATLEIYSNIEIDEVFNSYFVHEELIYNSYNQTIKLNNEDLLIDYGFTIMYEYNTQMQIDSGSYTITALIYKGNNLIYQLQDEYTINQLNVNIIFNNNSFYVNEDYNIECNIEDVEYIYYDLNNNKINKPTIVGEYYVEVISNNNNLNLLNNKIKFEIINDYNNIINQIVSNDKEVEFNYNKHLLLLPNHDELIEYGFEIHYYYDNLEYFPIESGEYNVVITIQKDDLYKEFHNTLIINKKHIKPIISGDNLIEASDSYSFEISVDSNYIDIDYIYYDLDGNVISKPNEVGHYFIKPILHPYHDNYEIEFTFKHFEIVLSNHDNNILNNIIFDDKEITYNGYSQSIRLSNHDDLINNGFHIEYSQETFISSGEYNVTMLIIKHGFIKEYNMILTINPIILNPYFEYLYIKEGDFYNFVVQNTNGIEYVFEYYDSNGYQIGKPSVYGNYTVVAVFNNELNDYIINDISLEYTINLSDFDQSILNNSYLESNTVEYDGNNHTLSISNAVVLRNNRYNISYLYNDQFYIPNERGVYNVVATISKNNIVVKILYATLVII